MKYASLILNAVLAVAVAVLYYLHFSAQAPQVATNVVAPQAKPVVKLTAEDMAKAAKGKVLFVNSDSLLENYLFYVKKKQELEAKGERLQKDIANRTQTLQLDMQSAQEKAQSGGMTEQQMQEVGMRLRQKEENLLSYKDEQLQKLGNEESKLSKQLNDNISDYLKEYCEQAGINYVFGYTKGGGLLYASDSLDITQTIVKGLNERYKSQNKK